MDENQGKGGCTSETRTRPTFRCTARYRCISCCARTPRWMRKCILLNVALFATFLFCSGVAALTFYLLDQAYLRCPDAGEVMQLLQEQDQIAYSLVMAAGNADSDAVRLTRLEDLKAHLISQGQGDSELAIDLDSMLPLAELWVNASDPKVWSAPEEDALGETGFLAGWWWYRVWPSWMSRVLGQELYYPKPTETEILNGLWAYYRGRMMIWNGIENGIFVDLFFGRGQTFIKCTVSYFPDNALANMYLGKAREWPNSGATTFVQEAPRWASLQKTAIERLLQVSNYWVARQRTSDGSFGGGANDDVEMWRWLAPVLLGFTEGESSELRKAMEKMANGVFAQGYMQGGFPDELHDVEHSAEESGDAVTMMLLLDPNSTTWKRRAMRLAELMSDLWTGTNDQGTRSFRSTYVSSKKVDDRAQHQCDAAQSVRAIQPSLLLWQQDPIANSNLTVLFSEWMDTWVQATAATGCGKPAGVTPSSITFPSARAGGPATADWWVPGCKTACLKLGTDSKLCAEDINAFQYPRAVALILEMLVLVAYLKPEEQCKYLYPVRAMAEFRLDYKLGNFAAKDIKTEGTAAWAAKKGVVADALAKHRLLTGSTEFDELLAQDGTRYTKFLLNHNETAGLEQGLEQLIQAFSVNLEAYTSEVRFTDRVIKFHDKFWNLYGDASVLDPQPGVVQLFNTPFQDPQIPGVKTQVLYEMLTGDVVNQQYLALPSVTWETSPRNFAALVTKNTPSAFGAHLFNFDNATRTIGAQILRVQLPMNWTLTCNSSGLMQSGVITSAESGQISPVTALALPSQEECHLEVLSDAVPLGQAGESQNCSSTAQLGELYAGKPAPECEVLKTPLIPIISVTPGQLTGITMGLVLFAWLVTGAGCFVCERRSASVAKPLAVDPDF